MQILDFYENNADRLESARLKMLFDGIPYPQMKLLDMGFWQIGLAVQKLYRKYKFKKSL